MSQLGVRRDKAALSSGCESHPAHRSSRNLVLKLLFTLSLIGIGSALLIRSMRPGQEGRKQLRLIFIPFLVAGLAGLAALVIAPPASWSRALLGTQWATCLCCIPLSIKKRPLRQSLHQR
jgi:hypothetical protein